MKTYYEYREWWSERYEGSDDDLTKDWFAYVIFCVILRPVILVALIICAVAIIVRLA